jgi:hypothetical protein
MALRLILVGVVASLALDLPHAGSRPIANAVRSSLVVELPRSLPDADISNSTTFARFSPRHMLTRVLTPTDELVLPTPTVETVATVEPITPALPILPGRAEADAILTAEKTILAAAPAPMPEPASLPVMPPAPEIASTIVTPNPSTEPVEAPIPTVVSAEPMPPPFVFEEIMAPEQAPAPAPVVTELVDAAKSGDSDSGFRQVVSKMATTFAADLPVQAPSTDPKPLLAKVEIAPDAPPALPVEELVVEDLDLYPGIAYALNREAEGVTPLVLAPVVKVEPIPELEWAPEPASIVTVESPIEPSRAEKLAAAVKLTGEAVNAWAGLLSQRPSVSAMQR